jgi:hypothetical protein
MTMDKSRRSLEKEKKNNEELYRRSFRVRPENNVHH